MNEIKFSKRLREERLKKKLTQAMLAEILKVDRTSISKYENGKQFPELCILNDIADFFDISLDYLAGRTDTRKPQDNSEENTPKDLLLGVQELSAESIEELEDYLKFLKIRESVLKSKAKLSSASEKKA